MEEPHAQLFFQLHHRVARGLRRNALIHGRLAQASELRRPDEYGDRTNFVHRHPH
jgi:hypothetical protein